MANTREDLLKKVAEIRRSFEEKKNAATRLQADKNSDDLWKLIQEFKLQVTLQRIANEPILGVQGLELVFQPESDDRKAIMNLIAEMETFLTQMRGKVAEFDHESVVKSAAPFQPDGEILLPVKIRGLGEFGLDVSVKPEPDIDDDASSNVTVADSRPTPRGGDGGGGLHASGYRGGAAVPPSVPPVRDFDSVDKPPAADRAMVQTAQFKTYLEQPYTITSHSGYQGARATVDAGSYNDDPITICAEVFEMMRRAGSAPGCKPEITLRANTQDPKLAFTFLQIAEAFERQGLVTLNIAPAAQALAEGLDVSQKDKISKDLQKRLSYSNDEQLVTNFMAIHSAKSKTPETKKIVSNYLGSEANTTNLNAIRNSGGLINALHGTKAPQDDQQRFGCISKLKDTSAYGVPSNQATNGSGLLGEEIHAVRAESGQAAIERIKTYQQPVAPERQPHSPRLGR